ncbi:MAG: bifunctional methylenetetrahydrofolate dehydrogenase/methenyltetrahydrofolate cyclohydrolase FolD [Burkholderiales bacterium]|nr:bifunctional methylenetetrahydrofolate dehydrogenase/methenyltetrahydrofolate cyclohydrolase FolD [Burkholderiales bacterium]
MPAKLIDGKAVAAQLRASLAPRVARLAARGVRPALAAVIVGDDPASQLYVRNKVRACADTGVRSEVHAFPADAGAAALADRIERLNADERVHGIIVQLPLPPALDAARLLALISPAKDVDGFHAQNLGALLQGRPGFVPGTPAGVLRLIEHAGVPIAGRRAVVIGRSTIVGKPTALLLLQRDATVTLCHSKTPDLAALAREADILVVAAGRAKLVGPTMVKPGACVIDVGINRAADGKVVGDVDFDAVRDVAGWLTPVPGGVGPMTVAMLIANTVEAAERTLD